MDRAHGDLVEQLADAGREVVARRLVLASGGNLSARLHEGRRFVVTGAGTWLDRLGPGDFSIVSVDDETLEGRAFDGQPRPSVEWKLHQRIYAARPDVEAVIHLHPQAAVLLDAMGHEVRLITSDHVFYLRRVVRVPFYPAGSVEIADAVAAATRDCDVVIMANHGSAAVGDSVAMALRRALNLEEAAEATFRCLALGDTTTTFPTQWLERVAGA